MCKSENSPPPLLAQSRRARLISPRLKAGVLRRSPITQTTARPASSSMPMVVRSGSPARKSRLSSRKTARPSQSISRTSLPRASWMRRTMCIFCTLIIPRNRSPSTALTSSSPSVSASAPRAAHSSAAGNQKSRPNGGLKVRDTITTQILFFQQSDVAPTPAACDGQHSNLELCGTERRGAPRVS